MKTPVFLIGNPRSGTSLTRLILTSHSSVTVPPECGFLLWLAPKYRDWTQDRGSCRVLQYVDDLLACKKFETWGLRKEWVVREIENSAPADYSSLSSCVYLAYGRMLGKESDVIGDKNNYYIRHVHDLLSIYSKARILHIVRDPRDVACSYRALADLKSSSPYAPSLPYDPVDIARQWVENIASVASACGGLPSDRIYTVRYEDLVSSPEDTIAGMCAWLGVGFEEQMLSFHSLNRSYGLEPVETLDWKRKTLEKIDGSSVGRFRQHLTPHQASMICQTAGREMKAFGYH